VAKSAGPTKPAKLSRAEKKEVRGTLRASKRARRQETWSGMKQAFAITRKNDRRMIPYVVVFGLAAAAVVCVLGWLVKSPIWMYIPIAVLLALLVGLLIFTRRAQKSMYAQAEGTPGAAGWLLQNQLRGDWRVTLTVGGNAQFDAVHRVLGRPGVVIVGEGAPNRARSLIAQEKKRVARAAGDTPIYDMLVGTEEGTIPLGRLNRELVKLPRNLSRAQVDTLEKRLSALGAGRPPMPQGPIPTGAKVRNLQRTVRRRS